MKILLAVDGSSYTQKMLNYVTMHKELFSADNDYTVLTVQPGLPPHVRASVGKEAANSYYADETEKVMAPIGQFLASHGISAKSETTVGTAGEAIAEFADKGSFDLLIMGSHGHSALGNLVMGSVATKVLAHGKVPVLLVR